MVLEYEATMKRLIKLVVRTFYEAHHVVIADILLESILLSDFEFCERMKMLGREFNKLIIKLKDDRLVKCDIKVESKEDNRQIIKSVYFFNYAEVRDVIKYKIFKMTNALNAKKVSEDESFYCGTCDRYFSALDAQAFVENYVFKCLFCRNELQENIKNGNEKGVDLKELLDALNDIIKLLKEADKYEIPSMDYFQVLELKKSREKETAVNEAAEIEKNEAENNPLRIGEDKETDSEEFSYTPAIEIKKEEKETEQIITVNGISKKFSEITEEDKDMMNEDEYTKYFEIYSRKS